MPLPEPTIEEQRAHSIRVHQWLPTEQSGAVEEDLSAYRKLRSLVPSLVPVERVLWRWWRERSLWEIQSIGDETFFGRIEGAHHKRTATLFVDYNKYA